MPALKKNRTLTIYALYAVVVMLVIILTIHIIIQFLSIGQLNKVTGIVNNTEVKITGYTSGGRFRNGKPYHSLVVTLNNNLSYYIEIKNWAIRDMIHKGDTVTIYFLPAILEIGGLDRVVYGERVSQVEDKGIILYNFDDQKQDVWLFIGIQVATILTACYRLYGIKMEMKSEDV